MKAFKLLIWLVVAFAGAGGAIWLVDHRQFFGARTGYVIGGLMLVFFVSLFFALMMLSSMRNSAAAQRQMKRKSPPPEYDKVAAKIAEIEAELKRMGAWQDAPLDAERYNFRQPFGMDTMAFEQWLQFILIPRVKELIETRGEFPPHSETAVHAVREFDGRTDTRDLETLLHEFDRLFGPVRFYGVE